MISNDKLERTVWCTFQFESWHTWPGAPEPFVYLASSHRHMFHVKVEVAVSHAERDIEFINFKGIVKQQAESVLVGGIHDPVPFSCETMAEKLIEFVSTQFGAKKVSVTVSEDGENGSTVNYSEKSA